MVVSWGPLRPPSLDIQATVATDSLKRGHWPGQPVLHVRLAAWPAESHANWMGTDRQSSLRLCFIWFVQIGQLDPAVSLSLVSWTPAGRPLIGQHAGAGQAINWAREVRPGSQQLTTVTWKLLSQSWSGTATHRHYFVTPDVISDSRSDLQTPTQHF